jgi:tight adherence protein B
MEKDFPSAIDIIVRGVKSGLPLNDCLRIVSREIPDPLGSEFARMVEQQGHGLPIAEAVDRLADRVPLTEVNFFAIVIGLQTKTGGRLAESLDNLVSVLRARVQLRAKIRSMSSEAKASGAIIAALPVVVTILVYITSPAYISLLFTEAIGNVVLIGSAIWMLIGVFVMRKMIAFDY